MPVLIFIIIALVLVLTGAIVPVLVFSGWMLVVVLALALLWMIFRRVLGFVLTVILSPFVFVAASIFERRQGPKFPVPGDPDFSTYLDWANGVGDYHDFRDWADVKRRRDWERRHAKDG